MPRPRLPARLYQRKEGGWSILDGSREIRTGTKVREVAEAALLAYRARDDGSHLYSGGHLSGPESRSALVRALASARARARAKGLAFDVDLPHLIDLLKSQRGLCALSRLPFSLEKPSGARARPFVPSLDRLVPALGYVRGNIRVVSCIANSARSDFGDYAFFRLCAATHRNLSL